MRKTFLALLIALLPALSFGQGPSSAQIEANKGNLKRVNVADLANANQSLMYRVLDGASASDCTSGGGSTQVVCYWDGTAWVAASGASGSGDVTAVGDCASGACFNGTQGTTLTFNNAGGDATLDYDGTDFSFSKPISVTGTIGLTSTITFPDNVRQTANPGADAAGLNVGSLAGDPGTPSNGDLWYDSTGNTLDARINGATVSLGAGGGAPTDATYITQTANGSLSAEQALGALSTGCLGSATTTGVVSAVTITGTANEVAVANGDCTGAPTLSLPATIDLGGKTSFEIPNGAAPTVDAFGEIAGDNDLWAASRGAPVFFDGTASTALVNVLVSDAPANGECPKWNTGGTITWESCAGGGVTIGDTQVAYATAANTLGGDAGMTYNAATDTLTLAGDAVASGGDITCGAAGQQCTISAPATAPANGLLLSIATAATGGTEYGLGISITGNLTDEDRVLCISDIGGTACNLGYMTGNGNMTINGGYTAGSSITAGNSVIASTGGAFSFTGRSRIDSDAANGKLGIENAAGTVGVHLQFLAAPTIASGFGTTPSIAGNDTAGRVTVGSGGTDATGTINFNATWATAPSCVCNNEVTTLLCKATATTTTLTLTSATAFTAADTLTYICLGY